MKTKVIIILFLFFAFNLPLISAEEKIKYTPKDKSPDEIMRYVQQAVDLVAEKGESVYDELTDADGPWADGDWYLYINNFEGFIVAHLNKKLVGKNMYGVRDVKGNAFYAQLQQNAQSERGYGWTEFWWPKPNSIEPSQKVGFVIRVPGRDVWVGTGLYDMKPEDISRLLKEQNSE